MATHAYAPRQQIHRLARLSRHLQAEVEDSCRPAYTHNLGPSKCTSTYSSGHWVPPAVEVELRGGTKKAELTAAETELAEQFYQLDLQGYLVIDDVLAPQEVDTLNGILDARGIAAGVPETFEPSTDAQGREIGHADFIDFGGETRNAGTTGSPIRFGSAGGGAPACPGFLNWGQPFADLLLHPRILPFLTEFLDASGYGVRLDRLYGMHMKQVKEKSGRASNGRRYPMGLHQGVVSLPCCTKSVVKFVCNPNIATLEGV